MSLEGKGVIFYILKLSLDSTKAGKIFDFFHAFPVQVTSVYSQAPTSSVMLALLMQTSSLLIYCSEDLSLHS